MNRNFEDKSICTVQELVGKFKTKYIKMWYESSSELPLNILGEKITNDAKHKNELKMDRSLNDLLLKIKNYPITLDEEGHAIQEIMDTEKGKELELWQRDFRKNLRGFINNFSKLKNGEMDILFTKGIAKVTESFINKAREFDDKLKIEEIGQAIRNVWIINIIQLMLSVPVEYTPSVFGYSMLYPYTDNFLDNNKIARQQKLEINDWFEACLNGKEIEATSEYEVKLYSLVKLIESQYPRKEFHEIYQSLLGIHKAQGQSLIQQRKATPPLRKLTFCVKPAHIEKDILGLSIEKGGISVLADAYLAKGILAEEEADFMFGYGVLLQLCDDLQDVDEDNKNGHMTIFLECINGRKIDILTNKLINFITTVMESDNYFISEENLKIKSLIKENCLALIFQAVSQNKKFYSKEYFKGIEEFSQFNFKYYERLKTTLNRKFKGIKKEKSEKQLERIIFSAFSNP